MKIAILTSALYKFYYYYIIIISIIIIIIIIIIMSIPCRLRQDDWPGL